MFIYGTIGLFRKYIDAPSSVVALARALFGALFLLVWFAVIRRKPDFKAIRANWKWLVLSGVLLGFNWIVLFEAYNYTSVAVATLCYYMGPAIVIAVSVLLFKEKLTRKKTICLILAFIGMILVSGITEGSRGGSIKGVLLGFLAACIYAGIVLLNMQLKDIEGLDRTVTQLAAGAVVMLPYVLATENLGSIQWTGKSLVMLFIICLVHTGVAYVLYFDKIGKLPAQTVAILSYVDPVVAVLCSAFILKEDISTLALGGAVLVIGALSFSEYERKT